MRTRDFDWKREFRYNILILKFCGMWPRGDESYGLNFYSFYMVFAVSCLTFALCLAQVINIFFIIYDLEAITSSLYVTMSCIGGFAKVYYLVQNMTNLKELFRNINNSVFLPKNSAQEEIMMKSVRRWKILFAVLMYMCFMTLIFWSSYPVLDKGTARYMLPFLAWYPFDFKQPLYYELTYLHQVLAIWYLVTASGIIDVLISGLNMFIGAQCDLLADKLRHIGKAQNTNVKYELVECVQHHRAILYFSEKSNIFYDLIVLLQLFDSAISIGFSMFLLTVVVPGTSQYFLFISYGSGVVIEIFIYCWFGNEVEVKSAALFYAIYECNWFDFPLEVKKEILILTIRLQKPIKLSALKLFYLSLETYKTILRTAWSYFAVLTQVHS